MATWLTSGQPLYLAFAASESMYFGVYARFSLPYFGGGKKVNDLCRKKTSIAMEMRSVSHRRPRSCRNDGTRQGMGRSHRPGQSARRHGDDARPQRVLCFS